MYAGLDDFVAQATPLVSTALEAEQPVLVALTPATLAGLREGLGRAAEPVRWIDITRIGRNPARIIPLWREFLAQRRSGGRDQPVFGIGQPVFPERMPAEMAEAQRHEALLNLAFAGTPNFDLYCPYDTETLDARVVAAAERTHPHLHHADGPRSSAGYRETTLDHGFSPRLAAAADPLWHLRLDGVSVAELHSWVLRQVRRFPVSEARWDNVALAALAVRAAIRGQEIRIWREPGLVVVELRGRVPIRDPLAGREWPAPAAEPGHGLWLANQLCDLVQWRSDRHQSVVRLQMAALP